MSLPGVLANGSRAERRILSYKKYPNPRWNSICRGMRGQGGAWSLVCGLWIPVALQFKSRLSVVTGSTAGDFPFPTTRGIQMEFKNIDKGTDAVLSASTSGQTSRVTVTELNTVASGLQPSDSPGGATGHISGESDRLSVLEQSVSTSATTSSVLGSRRERVSGDESSDNDSVCTIVPDNASLCSEKSGLTATGEEVSRLKLHADTGFVKFTSAERRRFKKAMASGLSREEALEAAKKNPSSKPEVKRIRSEEKSPELPPTKRPKTAHVGLNKPTYSQVVGSVKLGLTSADMVNRPLTAEQMALLQEAIIDVTIEHAEENVRPEFEGCLLRTGWLLLVCTNAQTAEWVRRNLVHIRAKCDFDIALAEEGQFPRTHVIRGYFPQSLPLTNEKVLASIGAQNPFSTAQWKVVQRLTHGQLLHLVMVIDDASMRRLTELKGRIVYRFGHIKLILKDLTSKDPAAKNNKQSGEEKPVGEAPGSMDPSASGLAAAGAEGGVAARGPSDETPAGPSVDRAAGRTGGSAAGAAQVEATIGSLPPRAGGSAKVANPKPKKKSPSTAKKGGSKGPRRAVATKLIRQSLSRENP